VWGGAIGFQQWGIPILLATATFCGGRFAQVFLGTREKISSLHKPINIALGICAVAFVSPFVVPYRVSILLAIVAVAVTSIFAFVAGWLGVIRGVRQARFYVIAWTVFLFGTVAIGLVALGVLPSNQITENAYVLGCIIEVIFLSFALADNYKLIQEEALRIRAESERDLQIAVDERTSELVEQRNELVVLTGELKSANDNLVSHQAQLVEAEKMSSLGALISGVAHEMNTPLATIQAGLRNLNREFDRSESAISEQAAEVIEVSGDAAKRLAGIVAALRQYARDDRTETEVFDLVEIVHNSVAIAKGGVKSVPIVVSAPDSVTVAAFPAKLSQVLCNLIVNAGQACEDAAEPEIEVRVSDTEENVLIEVRDNGPGVPDEVVDKIFDPFFTTKDVGAGTGLGLAISKSFVEEMQGELSYRRDEGQTVFVVSLVVSPSDAGQEAAS
jgi:C4-dicarboxylate-specific signal transduction histidine kinase